RVEVNGEDHARVAADRHEPDVGEGDLPGIQGHPHRQRQQAVDPRLRDQQLMRLVEADGIGEELAKEVHGSSYARSTVPPPSRPCGRRTSMRKRARNDTPARTFVPKASSAITSTMPRT